MPRKKKRFEVNGTKFETNPDAYDWAKEVVEKCPDIKLPICRDSLSKMNSDVVYLRLPDSMIKISKYIHSKSGSTFLDNRQVMRTAMSAGLELLKSIFLDGNLDYYGKELCEYFESQKAMFRRLDMLEMVKFRTEHIVSSVKSLVISEETAYEMIDKIYENCEPETLGGVEKIVKETLYRLGSPDIHSSYKTSRGHLKTV